jgi:drug/metabolite transporter (DMT)-like permease
MPSAESTLVAPETPVTIAPTPVSKAGAPAKFGATDIGLVLMAAIWGAHYTVIKYGLQTMAPFTFSALRMVSALIILVALAATVRDTPRPSWRDIKVMMALGLLGNGVYQLLFMIAMTETRAGIAALIIAASPAWVAITGQVFGRERVTARSWYGIGLQLLGVSCVVLSTNMLEGADGASLYTLLIILCGIIWSVYTVLLQPYTKRVHPLHLSVATLSSGALLMFVVALPGLAALNFAEIAPSAWWALSYSTILAMIVAYLLYYRGIRVIGPTRTAVYGNLQPVIAIAVAWVLLREAPGPWQWVGTILIMSGLLLSRSAPVKPITDTHPIP